MDISPASRPRLRRSLLIVPVALLLSGGVLAACGGSKAASSAPAGPAATGSASNGAAGNGNRAGGAAPAAYGLAAEITGSTVEVQDPATGQVTVNFTTGTAFSQTRTVTAAAIKVGGCVTAIGARTGTSGSASPAPTGQRAATPTSFTAASVVISPAVNGSCAAAAFGGGGFGGGGRGARPSGSARPTDRPSGSGGLGGGFGGGGLGGVASGKVGQLSSSVMQVQVAARGNQPASVDTVTLAASTTYTETATVTSTALKVGECVSATGKADSTGAVAATRIALSTAGPNGCTTGFGRRPQASPSSTGA